jgi:hypothetical protein
MTCLTRCTMRIVGDNHQVFHHPEVLLNHQHSYCQRYCSTINTHIDGNHSSRYNSRGINSRLMTMSHVGQGGSYQLILSYPKLLPHRLPHFLPTAPTSPPPLHRPIKPLGHGHPLPKYNLLLPTLDIEPSSPPLPTTQLRYFKFAPSLYCATVEFLFLFIHLQIIMHAHHSFSISQPPQT